MTPKKHKKLLQRLQRLADEGRLVAWNAATHQLDGVLGVCENGPDIQLILDARVCPCCGRDND